MCETLCGEHLNVCVLQLAGFVGIQKVQTTDKSCILIMVSFWLTMRHQVWKCDGSQHWWGLQLKAGAGAAIIFSLSTRTEGKVMLVRTGQRANAVRIISIWGGGSQLTAGEIFLGHELS